MASLEPRAPDVRRVRALLDLGRVDRALSELHALLAHDPEDPDALELLALCHIRVGEPGKAREVLRAALGLAPDRAHLHYLAGHAASREKDSRQAEPAFREALRLEPEEPVYLRATAEYLAQHKRHDEALVLARRAVTVGPDRSSNHRTLGFVASAAGQLDLAWQAYSKAIELDPEDGDAWNNLGCVAFSRGDRLLARSHFREALRLDPHGERSRQNLALVVPATRPTTIHADWEAFLAEVLRDLVDAQALGGPVRGMALLQAMGQPAVTRALTVRLEQKGALGKVGVLAGAAALRTGWRRLAPSSARAWVVAGAAMGLGWLAMAQKVTPLRRRFVEQIFMARKAWDEARTEWLEGRMTRVAREGAVVRLLERLAMMLAQDPGSDERGADKRAGADQAADESDRSVQTEAAIPPGEPDARPRPDRDGGTHGDG